MLKNLTYMKQIFLGIFICLLSAQVGFSQNEWKETIDGNYASAFSKLVASQSVNKPIVIDNHTTTPLIYACKKGNVDFVKKLIEKGARVNQRAERFTPAMAAAESGCIECMNLLLAAGASLLTKSATSKTPFDYAVENGHDDLAKLILAKETRQKEDVKTQN
jgi:ankyrin repeat protein